MSFFNPDDVDRDWARVRADLLSAPATESAIESPRSTKPAHFANILRRLRASWREQVGLQERIAINNRPWIAHKAR
jgi:hypothetical protein